MKQLYFMLCMALMLLSGMPASAQKSYGISGKVKVVDTVGAGDAFSGSLIGALLTGRTIEEAHRTAVETAAYVCTCAGAWPPPRK